MSENKNPETMVDDLLHESRIFYPSDHFKIHAHVKDQKIYKVAKEDRLAYWEKCAQRLDWFEKWDEVLEWKPPYSKWFIGGKLNASYNCLDRHIKQGRGHKTALIWQGEPGDSQMITYDVAFKQVNKFANVLKELGVGKGDRVAIYMPMVPEAVYSMLACARIGAIHTVVFGGFSVDSLKDRINDAKAKLLITADGGYRRGRIVPLKDTADKALEGTQSIEKVLVVERTKNEIQMKKGRDFWYHNMMERAGEFCEPEEMDAEDVLFILYTSGTTGKPKGIVHTTGGYMTGVTTTSHLVFDLKPEDVFWCTADVGWITGHSYIVYGPMANGATQVIYEGTPDYPNRDRFWELVEKYKVTIFYTAPTAIRAFMKWGKHYPAARNLSSLRLLGTVGEPINPEAWIWYHQEIGKEKCPIVDTW
ncbi:MAG: acetate--CoA ligase, partial [Candidatus Omnitrophica bacterium]|nr:acetate--CoA ligase [Candidatus Omnitrophota bacterium]